MLLEPFLQRRGGRGLRLADDQQAGRAERRHAALQVGRQPGADDAFRTRCSARNLSEFHSGYRLYSTKALARIPFERNSNDFHFDTDIIVQLHFAGLRIMEIPIPTFYGDEICHVNGMKYAWDIFRTMLRAKFHEMNLLYDRKFDVGQVELTYDLKLGFPSSHTFAIEAVQPGATRARYRLRPGLRRRRARAKRAAHVTGIDQYVPDTSTGAERGVRRAGTSTCASSRSRSRSSTRSSCSM